MSIESEPLLDQRLLRNLWYCVGVSFLVAILLWATDPKIVNDTVTTSSWITTDAQVPGFAKTSRVLDKVDLVPVEWIRHHKRNGLLWLALLAAWFFPAKVLIHSSVKNRIWQTVFLVAIFFLATIWILSRLVIWDEWPGVILKHNTIGTPIKYLFVPFVFAICDQVSRREPPAKLVRRIPIETILVVPWSFAWAMFQLLVLHWTWL